VPYCLNSRHKFRFVAKILFLISTLFVSFVADAQIETFQLSLKDSNTAVLYSRFIPNRVRISGIKGNDKITLTNSFIQYRKDDLLVIACTCRATTDTLRIERNGRTVFSKVYSVKALPDMAARWGNIVGEFAIVNQVLSNSEMQVYFGSDTLYNAEYFHILSYSVNVKPKRGDELFSSHLMSVEQRKKIATLRPGDVILFEDIRLSCSDCSIQLLKAFSITIR
jgi:hypothetical protein